MFCFRYKMFSPLNCARITGRRPTAHAVPPPSTENFKQPSTKLRLEASEHKLPVVLSSRRFSALAGGSFPAQPITRRHQRRAPRGLRSAADHPDCLRTLPSGNVAHSNSFGVGLQRLVSAFRRSLRPVGFSSRVA